MLTNGFYLFDPFSEEVGKLSISTRDLLHLGTNVSVMYCNCALRPELQSFNDTKTE